MTPKEALNVLSNTNFSVNNEAEEQKCRVYQAAFKTAIEALEKQIPKKPYDVDEEYKTFDCPACLSKLYADDDVRDCGYCCVCGQRLDWSDTND